MLNSKKKRVNWPILLCAVLICGLYSFYVLWPALSATRASQPLFKITGSEIGTDHLVAFTPDGKQFIYSGGQKLPQIRRWDAQNFQELDTIKTDRPVKLLTPNGLYYVTSTYQPKHNKTVDIRVFRLSDQQQIAHFPGAIPHGKLMQIIGDAPQLVIYDATTKHSSQDAQHRIRDRSFYFYDIATQQFINRKPHRTTLYDYPSNLPENAAYSWDATKVLSLWPVYSHTQNGITSQIVENLKPWSKDDEQTPREAWLLNEVNGDIIKLPFPKKLTGTDFVWENPALSSEGNYYAATSTNTFNSWSDNGEDGTVWCYDLSQRKLAWKYFHVNQFPNKLSFSPDQSLLAVGGYDNEYRNNGGFLKVIDVTTGKVIHDFTEQNLWEQISDRSKKIAAGFWYDNALFQKKFNMTLEEYYRKPPPGNSGLPTSLAWSPDSKTLGAAYADGSIKIWKVK